MSTQYTANRQRTIHKPAALRVLALILACTSFAIGFLLLYNALRNGKTTGWQLLVINVFAQTFMDIVASEMNRFGESDA